MTALPSTWPILGAVVAASFVAGSLAGWQANGWRLGGKLADLHAEHAALVSKAERETAEAERTQRTEEQRRIAAQQEVAHVASIARERDQADRRAADVQHQRMLDAAVSAAVSAGRACQDPSTATGSQAAVGAVSALADVLGEVDRAAGEMAAAADAARTAGLACIDAYRALK